MRACTPCSSATQKKSGPGCGLRDKGVTNQSTCAGGVRGRRQVPSGSGHPAAPEIFFMSHPEFYNSRIWLCDAVGMRTLRTEQGALAAMYDVAAMAWECATAHSHAIAATLLNSG